MPESSRKMVILTDGHIDAHRAKTAICTVRYRPEEVAAVLDRSVAGKTCGQVLGTGGDIPIVATLDEAPQANTLLIGIAPPGGKIPAEWKPIVLDAIRRGMNVVSGLHDFLSHDPDFSRAAAEHGVQLIDLRANDENDVANREGIRPDCLRIQTIANDCSCGKMVASVEITEGLERRGVDAAFAATGQTGMIVAGSGVCVDRVISDFVSGAAEKLVLNNQHHDVIVVEGQGSLFHPRYSGVTLGLLHGVMPHGLILVYEMGREVVYGMEQISLAPLATVVDFYEAAANIMHPCRVIGVAVNGQKYGDEEVAEECRRVEQELGLPACDVIRHGPEKLVDAVLKLRDEVRQLDGE
jgi:uncharacterized NAD-dependent epimerase/dehydratase family protein